MSLSLAENVIVAGADNCPPMLNKTQYSSWTSRMLLYIKEKENKKLLVDLVLNRPFKYGIVIESKTATTLATVKDRRYNKLTDAKKISEACDNKATNIVLQGLPQDIYNLERESKLYDEFDMFTLVSGETIHEPEWSKFITDVKLAKDLHGTNFEQLYAYSRQHEDHANEVCIMKERFPNPLALVANTYNSCPSYSNETSYHQQLLPFASQQQVSPLASQKLYDVPMVQQRSYRASGYACSCAKSNATTLGVNKTRGTNISGQAMVIRCYNCQKEGHMARQCTKPKRPRNLAWFKEKAMLAEDLKLGVVLDEEQIVFLADTRDIVMIGQQCSFFKAFLVTADVPEINMQEFWATTNTKAYKEYYTFATGEAVPKPKASARRKRSGSDTYITPPTATTTPKKTVAVTPRLTAAAKGKQIAKSLSAPSEVARTEAQ
nr:hypothetical protein [Tanacetum cinerariifolium]